VPLSKIGWVMRAEAVQIADQSKKFRYMIEFFKAFMREISPRRVLSASGGS
jgi:hypothetical protein